MVPLIINVLYLYKLPQLLNLLACSTIRNFHSFSHSVNITVLKGKKNSNNENPKHHGNGKKDTFLNATIGQEFYGLRMNIFFYPSDVVEKKGQINYNFFLHYNFSH